jgi:hypothetical protein
MLEFYDPGAHQATFSLGTKCCFIGGYSGRGLRLTTTMCAEVTDEWTYTSTLHTRLPDVGMVRFVFLAFVHMILRHKHVLERGLLWDGHVV